MGLALKFVWNWPDVDAILLLSMLIPMVHAEQLKN